MKKIFLTVYLAILTAFSAFAYENLAFVYDEECRLFSEVEAATLDEEATEIGKEYDCAVYIVIVEDMQLYGYSRIEQFSEYWYKKSGYGLGSEKTGVMLILSMRGRDYDICAYGSKAHRAFTDYGKKYLEGKFLDDFKNNSWYYGCLDYLRASEELLKLEADGKPYDVDSKPPLPWRTCILVSLIAGIIVAFIVCQTMKSKMGKVREASDAQAFIISDSLSFSNKIDRFTHTTETRTKIEQANTSSGARGGTTINSGGFSHSSGKF